jgi:hypothetical protein
MQVFVVRNDLLVEDSTHPVHVLATYPNETPVAIDLYGTGNTLLVLADAQVYYDRDNMSMVLRSTWRDDWAPVVNAEANRRIVLAFPEYKQRNYTAAVQTSITTYGTDTSTWPQVDQDNKAEGDRGWQYVSDVRAAANGFSAMPVDPTSDTIWPVAITPIK